MTELDKVVEALDRYCEIEGAEDWDNVGLLVCPLRPAPVTRVLLCVDCTMAVIDEAAAQGAQLVVAYHPVIFSGWKRITPAAGTKQRVVCAALAANVAVYCPHSSLDVKRGGVTDWLAQRLAGSDADVTRPHDTDSSVSGAIRVLDVRPGAPGLTPAEVSRRLHSAVGEGGYVRAARALGDAAAQERPARRLAVCVGSGGSALGGVRGADALVTGEMSHHAVLECVERGVHVFLSEHTATERGFLADVLRPELEALLRPLGIEQVLVAKSENEILRLL